MRVGPHRLGPGSEPSGPQSEQLARTPHIPRCDSLASVDEHCSAQLQAPRGGEWNDGSGFSPTVAPPQPRTAPLRSAEPCAPASLLFPCAPGPRSSSATFRGMAESQMGLGQPGASPQGAESSRPAGWPEAGSPQPRPGEAQTPLTAFPPGAGRTRWRRTTENTHRGPREGTHAVQRACAQPCQPGRRWSPTRQRRACVFIAGRRPAAWGARHGEAVRNRHADRRALGTHILGTTGENLPELTQASTRRPRP